MDTFYLKSINKDFQNENLEQQIKLMIDNVISDHDEESISNGNNTSTCSYAFKTGGGVDSEYTKGLNANYDFIPLKGRGNDSRKMGGYGGYGNEMNIGNKNAPLERHRQYDNSFCLSQMNKQWVSNGQVYTPFNLSHNQSTTNKCFPSEIGKSFEHNEFYGKGSNPKNGKKHHKQARKKQDYNQQRQFIQEKPINSVEQPYSQDYVLNNISKGFNNDFFQPSAIQTPFPMMHLNKGNQFTHPKPENDFIMAQDVSKMSKVNLAQLNGNLVTNYGCQNTIINMNMGPRIPVETRISQDPNLFSSFVPEGLPLRTNLANGLRNSSRTSLESIKRIEIEETLENNLNINEEITEEIFSQFKGHFYRIVSSRNGSRILQKCLVKTSKEIISKIFKEIGHKIYELMNDSYANYFCQKFFVALEKIDRIKFLSYLRPFGVFIATSKVGTYPLQAIIESLIYDEEKYIIIETFKNDVVELSLEPQGTHIIEKIIGCFEEEMLVEYYDKIKSNLCLLVTNVSGLGVIKRTIAKMRNPKTIEFISCILINNALELVQNPYGNYAIQIAIDKLGKTFSNLIFQQLRSNLIFLSMQKFSSNVLEKCFEHGKESIVEVFIKEICFSDNTSELMLSNYGNYVVQKALKVASKKDKILLINNIFRHIRKIKDKKLNQKWKNIIESNLEDTLDDFTESQLQAPNSINTNFTNNEDQRDHERFQVNSTNNPANSYPTILKNVYSEIDSDSDIVDFTKNFRILNMGDES